ncbi:MAG: DUF5011 domain-containing protein [Candidatus Zambryskibacteria bacterium]|nr:DUF5011 domain-containing protein [Candidatus Zambryskibacteria bacterium]
MNKIRNISKQVLIVFFIVSFLFFGLVEKGYAYMGIMDVGTDPFILVTTSSGGISSAITAGMTTAEKIKDFVIDPAARIILKTIIKKLTAQTVNWINSGFKGNPGYVTDPSQFFLDVADNTASQFLSETQLNKLCSPFRVQVRLALVKNYLQEDSYVCTLNTLKDNYEAFTQDFTQGGWNGWFEMTQTNGGNPYNAYFAAESQLLKGIASKTNQQKTELNQGGGFLSYEKCKKGTTYAEKAAAAGILVSYPPGSSATDCDQVDKQTVTPGSVIESQLNSALGTDLRQLEVARSVDEIASALITQLFSKVMSNIGLKGDLRGEDNPIPEVTVPSNNKPFITLESKNPLVILRTRPGEGQDGASQSAQSTFIKPGAFGYDYREGDISNRVTSTGTVNTTITGIYRITYNLKNSLGVSADPVILIVKVVNDLLNPDDTTRDECIPPPTAAEKKEAEDAIDFMIPLLEAIPKMNPVVSPPPVDYQAAVEDVVSKTNARFPNVKAAYTSYANDNVIAMVLNYIVGPADHVVSNQVPMVTVWTNAWRVTCDTGGQCLTPPPDGDYKHGNHTAEVIAAKAELVSLGLWTWTENNLPAPGDTAAIQKYEWMLVYGVKQRVPIVRAILLTSLLSLMDIFMTCYVGARETEIKMEPVQHGDQLRVYL